MMEAEILRKAFGNDQVLGEISFTVNPAECVALLGPSGIGKTTLLRIVAGLDTEFKGHVSRPEKISMVFQEPTLLRWRSARQNLTLATAISSEDADTALNEVGLADKGDLFPDQLSLGQQRRLSLARAFAARPDFLIMDEPFASLDPERASSMIELTRKLLQQHGVAALFVTHSKHEAARLSTRILQLSGQPATLLES